MSTKKKKSLGKNGYLKGTGNAKGGGIEPEAFGIKGKEEGTEWNEGRAPRGKCRGAESERVLQLPQQLRIQFVIHKRVWRNNGTHGRKLLLRNEVNPEGVQGIQDLEKR